MLTKGSHTWQSISYNLPPSNVHSIIFFENKLYIATQHGVHTKTLTGTSWSLLVKGLPATLAGQYITSFVAYNNTLYAGTSVGLFALTNNLWQRVSFANGQNFPVISLSVDSTNQLSVGTLFGLWRLPK